MHIERRSIAINNMQFKVPRAIMVDLEPSVIGIVLELCFLSWNLHGFNVLVSQITPSEWNCIFNQGLVFSTAENMSISGVATNFLWMGGLR